MQAGTVTYGLVPVATGKASAPTAPGTFHVTWKDLHHRSSEFHNTPMPYAVFFNGGDAFHQGSVTVRSNGCVHLTQPAAQTFTTPCTSATRYRSSTDCGISPDARRTRPTISRS